jgi:DNA-binding winged helix-turn-helix (wHTH) protein
MSGRFAFSEFELDVDEYALRRAGERIKLERIPMELLILLIRNAGALVDRKTIQASLWGAGVFVEHDAAINTAVRKVRQTLRDDAEKPRFVETVVGKGYRFIASLSPGQQPGFLASYSVARGARQFVLEGGENLLGRDPGARVHIDHPSVSRRHARILIRSNQVILEDLESRNGTFLEGQPVEAPTEVRDGAIIGLGPITLTFLVASGAASTRPMQSMKSMKRTRNNARQRRNDRKQ